MGSTRGKQARTTPFRWAVLVMMCIAIYSFVYCYDNPNALQNELIREYGISQMQYSMLYSIYGYVNIISPLIAGLLIDCIGIYSSTLWFYVLIVVGQSLWTIACFKSVSSYGLMVFGRAIFGIGAEQFHTSRKWLCFEYFTGAEYMLASGITLSASRFGSATQSYATTEVYNENGVVASLAVGWCLVVFSLILVALFVIYQKYYYKKISTSDNKNDGLSASLSQAANNTEKEALAINKNKDNSEIEIEQITVPKLEADNFNDNDKDWDKNAKQRWSKFEADAILKCKFDIRFWLFGMVLIFFYSTYLAYSNVGSAFIQARYQKTYEEGNSLAPIMFWIAAIFTPIQGFLCDYYGHRMPFMLLSGFCLLLGHIFLGFIGGAGESDAYLIIGLILLGLGYSIGAGSCWPCCGIIVQQRYLATALGFWACIDNGFQAACFSVVGALTKVYSKEEYDKLSPNPVREEEFDDCRYFWVFMAVATIFWTLLLWYADYKKGKDILRIPEEKFFLSRKKLHQIPPDQNDDEGISPITNTNIKHPIPIKNTSIEINE